MPHHMRDPNAREAADALHHTLVAIDGQLASAEDALVEALHIMPDEASLHAIDRRLADLAWALESIRADLVRVMGH